MPGNAMYSKQAEEWNANYRREKENRDAINAASAEFLKYATPWTDSQGRTQYRASSQEAKDAHTQYTILKQRIDETGYATPQEATPQESQYGYDRELFESNRIKNDLYPQISAQPQEPKRSDQPQYTPERTFEENYELLKNELAQNAKAVERYDPNWLEKYNSEWGGKPLLGVVGALESRQLQWLRKNYDNILGMRLNQTSTSQQQAAAPSFAAPSTSQQQAAPSFTAPKISVSKTVLTRKAAPVEPLVRTVNADMLDYSAYTGRSAAIAKATLSRKALETYQARIAAQTAGMPITDISRR